MKKNYIKILIILIILIFSSNLMNVQGSQVISNEIVQCDGIISVFLEGQVFDAQTHLPLEGVEVFIKTDPSIKTLTDKSSYYKLRLLWGDYTFIYKKSGYQDYEMKKKMITCWQVDVELTPLDIDAGLRIYDGQKIIPIACEPIGTLTSPLRIHKNGITYGIVLVDPSHADASKIKIQTSSGIKALKEYKS